MMHPRIYRIQAAASAVSRLCTERRGNLSGFVVALLVPLRQKQTSRSLNWNATEVRLYTLHSFRHGRAERTLHNRQSSLALVYGSAKQRPTDLAHLSSNPLRIRSRSGAIPNMRRE